MLIFCNASCLFKIHTFFVYLKISDLLRFCSENLTKNCWLGPLIECQICAWKYVYNNFFTHPNCPIGSTTLETAPYRNTTLRTWLTFIFRFGWQLRLEHLKKRQIDPQNEVLICEYTFRNTLSLNHLTPAALEGIPFTWNYEEN